MGDERTAQVWSLAWRDLGASQQGAAQVLGLDEASWDKKAGSPEAQMPGGTSTWKKSWSQLTEAEQRAAMTLGVKDAGAWESAREKDLNGVWEKRWNQLTKLEQQAAQELGISSEDAWDEASWKAGGAWGRGGTA